MRRSRRFEAADRPPAAPDPPSRADPREREDPFAPDELAGIQKLLVKLPWIGSIGGAVAGIVWGIGLALGDGSGTIGTVLWGLGGGAAGLVVGFLAFAFTPLLLGIPLLAGLLWVLWEGVQVLL